MRDLYGQSGPDLLGKLACRTGPAPLLRIPYSYVQITFLGNTRLLHAHFEKGPLWAQPRRSVAQCEIVGVGNPTVVLNENLKDGQRDA